MNIYSIALFFHIAGALGFFIVQGVEWIGLSQLRNSVLPEEAHAILGVVKKANLLAFVSMLAIVVTGTYMTLTVWQGAPWIFVVLGAFFLEFLLFMVLSRPRMAAIEQALDTEESPLSKTFHTLVNHPSVWISAQTRIAILLGIIFLKVAKPDLSGSLLTIAIAIVLGLASAFPELRRERVPIRPAMRMLVALFVTVLVAVLVLLAAKTISASNLPAKTNSNVQNVQAKPLEVPTKGRSLAQSTQVPTPSPETVLQQEGPSILQAQCTQCHSLQKVLNVKKTSAGWEETLARMESYGTKINDSEKNLLLDYLTNVNKP